MVTNDPMESDSQQNENDLCSLISSPSKQTQCIKYNLTSVLGTLSTQGKRKHSGLEYSSAFRNE